jgi:uncharacterized glyoxalase superfamily protein PhnB
MVKVIPAVSVPRAIDTIELYKELFDAKLVTRMPFNPEMGANFGLPEDFDYENSTMHAELDLGNGAFIYIDDRLSNQDVANAAVQVFVEVDSKDAIEAIWQKVQDKCFKVVMPLDKMFWGAWYMGFVDSDGTMWQVGFPEGPPPGSSATAAKPAAKPAKAAGKKGAKKSKK